MRTPAAPGSLAARCLALAMSAAVAVLAGCAGRAAPITSPLAGPPAASPGARVTPTPPGAAGAHAAPEAAVPPRLTPAPRERCPDCPPAEHLAFELDHLFATPALRQAILGIKVQSLLNGEILYELNADTLLVPASNAKILTMAVAAERLGWDFRFETRLETDAPIGRGVLGGDLIVVGGGDPTINSRDEASGAFTRGTADSTAVFARMADALAALGITRIDGRIIGDDNAFDDERYGFGWSWDDFAYGYQAPVASLQFNENLVQVAIRPGAAVGAAPVVELRPDAGGLSIVNRAVTTARGTPPALDVFRYPNSTSLEVRGSVPIDAGETVRDAAVDNPTLFFTQAFRAALVARGIDVRGEAVDIDDLPGASAGQDGSKPRRVLARHQSAPLSEIGRTLMKVSQNLYAETALRALSLTPGPATVAASLKVEEEVLAGWGIAPGQYVLADGSGLSRHNLVTASTVLRVLEVMARSPRHAEPFEATLPVAGVDGTLSSRLRATRAEGNVKAKTGTLLRVRSLSGYLTTADGERLVFSMLANHFPAPTRTVDAVVDQALERLASFTRRQ
jgi:D-alanyl-D-alanine carboxypeptidase/D-alanyl-D-alanine-endopeptidase (penicillin-binding protein 4)